MALQGILTCCLQNQENGTKKLEKKRLVSRLGQSGYSMFLKHAEMQSETRDVQSFGAKSG